MNPSSFHNLPTNLDRRPHRSGFLEAEFSHAVQRARLSPPAIMPQSGRTQSWGKRWAIALIDFLTGQPNIAIRPKYVRGALQWIAYDSQNDQRHLFYSEQAVRAWLEARHAGKI